VATSAASRALALPLYPDLTDGDVERVCAAVWDFYRTKGRAADEAAGAAPAKARTA
jgi:hypothetical protein